MKNWNKGIKKSQKEVTNNPTRHKMANTRGRWSSWEIAVPAGCYWFVVHTGFCAASSLRSSSRKPSEAPLPPQRYLGCSEQWPAAAVLLQSCSPDPHCSATAPPSGQTSLLQGWAAQTEHTGRVWTSWGRRSCLTQKNLYLCTYSEVNVENTGNHEAESLLIRTDSKASFYLQTADPDLSTNTVPPVHPHSNHVCAYMHRNVHAFIWMPSLCVGVCQ